MAAQERNDTQTSARHSSRHDPGRTEESRKSHRRLDHHLHLHTLSTIARTDAGSAVHVGQVLEDANDDAGGRPDREARDQRLPRHVRAQLRGRPLLLPDGRITAANPAAGAMLGVAPDEICRLGHAGLFDQEDPRWKLGVAERDRTGSTVSVARLRGGDGRMVDIEVTSVRFRDADGSTRICSILHDISGRTAIEREMEELERTPAPTVPWRRTDGLPKPARPHRRRQPAAAVRRRGRPPRSKSSSRTWTTSRT